MWRLVHSCVDVLLAQIVIVKESPERELEEAVMRLPRVRKVVAAPRVLRVVHLVRVHRVEVARIRRVVDLRHVGRLLRAQILPKVDALEERVRLHLVRILAEPPICAAAQLQNQIGRLGRQFCLWRYSERRLPVDHLERRRQQLSYSVVRPSTNIKSSMPTHLILSISGGVGEERRLSHQHFVQNNADTPPVAKCRVATALEDLRGNIVRGADERVCQPPLVIPLAASTEMGSA